MTIQHLVCITACVMEPVVLQSANVLLPTDTPVLLVMMILMSVSAHHIALIVESVITPPEVLPVTARILVM